MSATAHAKDGGGGHKRGKKLPKHARALQAQIDANKESIESIQLTPGPAGADGATGPQGSQGLAGADGATGPAGADGADGATGSAGADGATGPQGPQGLAGADGATGATGPAGADGADGATGPAGGADGATGPQGPQGLAGADGATGPAGADAAVEITVLDGPECKNVDSFTTTYTKIPDTEKSFTQVYSDSMIEVTFNGRIGVTGSVGTGQGAYFELRVDDAATTNGRARASFRISEIGIDGVPVSMTGIFTGLGSGSHTVSFWVRSTGGTGTDAILNPGCWAADHIIIKEF